MGKYKYFIFLLLVLASTSIYSAYYSYLLGDVLSSKNQYIAYLEETIEQHQQVIAVHKDVNRELKEELLSRRIVITQEERELLEKLVEAEAGSEPYEGKIAVVNVVFNRVNSSYYPHSVKDVVFQPYQFTPAHNGKINSIQPRASSIKAVEEALEGKATVPANTLFFVALDLATDFTVPNTRPQIMTIGNHTFYR